MKSILSERNIVVVLFIMVLITFSLAHEDTKKMEQIYQGSTSSTAELFDPLHYWNQEQSTEIHVLAQPAAYNQ